MKTSTMWEDTVLPTFRWDLTLAISTIAFTAFRKICVESVPKDTLFSWEQQTTA